MAISQTPKQGRAWAEARRGGEDGSQGWAMFNSVQRLPLPFSGGLSLPPCRTTRQLQHRDWLGRCFGQGSEQKCQCYFQADTFKALVRCFHHHSGLCQKPGKVPEPTRHRSHLQLATNNM